MAAYTTQVRTIVESGHKIFDFDYPIFDPNYKTVLEKKILDYYYFREIGFETVGQFKHFLKSKLNTIMPLYNKLYETEGLVTIQNYNINLDNTITKTNKVDQSTNGKSNSNISGNGTSSSNSSGTTTNKDVFSDTPQARLEGKDYATTLNEGNNDNTDTTETENNESTVGEATTEGTMTTTEEYVEHLLGNGSMRYNADILMEFRKSFLNVDREIIEDLNELFMNIY